MTLLLDHLWQSTLVAALAGLLALGLGRNGAAVRFWLWFAASMKFLVPFAALAVLGRRLSAFYALPISLPLPVVRPAAEMVLVPARNLMPSPDGSVAWAWLMVPWLAGAAALVLVRLVRWRRLASTVRASRPGNLAGPLAIRLSTTSMEPGLVGILRPVILLPDGLIARMEAGEMDAILAHEAAHHRRRDNLTAALHMLTETLFWFWPVVWLVGARMIAERERACDERVLADGHDPHAYASGILKVCRFCARTPLACVSGASATGLSGRVERIALGTVPEALSPARAMMLASLGLLLTAAPLVTGMEPAQILRKVRQQAAVMQDGIRDAATRIAEISLPPAIHPASLARVPRVHQPAVTPLPVLPPLPAVPVHADPKPTTAPATVPIMAVKLSVPTPAVDMRQALAHAHLALVPSGAGEPDAVTCRVPQYLPASRLKGPQICKTNRIWALLRARSLEFSADGMELVSTAHGVRSRLARKAG